jgi:16S rRNA (uracil1498-N3)-methyltransferase
MPSVYYPGLEKLAPNATLTLEAEEFHHLAHVAHRRVKDEVTLNSGRGVMAKARLESVGTRSAILKIASMTDHPKPAHPFAIAFALLKNRHDELIVEKCTELGAMAFFPLITLHSVRQASERTQQRFEKVALAAIKQCDNPWLPEVHEPQSLEMSLEAIVSQGYTPVVCSERRPDIWLQDLDAEKLDKPCFMIGAEGGWSEWEFSLLNSFQEISLGDLVTRAETAAISAAAQWLAYARQNKSLR